MDLRYYTVEANYR